MTEDQRRAAADVSIRAALAISCFYAVYGVVLPYLAQWLKHERGLDGAAIGAVLSISQIARVVTGPAIALWADRAKDRRSVLRLLAAGALIAHVLFFFCVHDFWALLLTAFVALTMSQAATPFIEAAVLRATLHKGSLPYGVARGLGSLSFIIANIAGGVLIARFGPGAIVAWVMTTLVLYAMSVWLGLKYDPPPPRPHEEGAQKAAIKKLFLQKRFWILIAASGLIQSSHAFYYGFSNLSWLAQGVPAAQVGLLWGCAVAAEVGFLFALPFIERRVSLEALIIIGGAGAALRWTVLGFAPIGIVLWPIQALHACSFACTHVAVMRLIMREAPERVQGLAQTLYSGIATGAMMGLATLLAGRLYDEIGTHGYWVMAAMGAAGALTGLALLFRPVNCDLRV